MQVNLYIKIESPLKFSGFPASDFLSGFCTSYGHIGKILNNAGLFGFDMPVHLSSFFCPFSSFLRDHRSKKDFQASFFVLLSLKL